MSIAPSPDTAMPLADQPWLEQLGLWCPDKSADIGTWCVAKLSGGVESAGLFIPNLTSPSHIAAIAAIIVLIVSFRSLVEWTAVTHHVVREKLSAALEQRRKRLAERAHRLETARFEALSDAKFDAIIRRLKAAIARHEQKAEILVQTARQTKIGILSVTLGRCAIRHTAEAAALSKELDRLNNLWLFTARRREDKRLGEKRAQARRHVLGLMQLLHASYEVYAQDALAELNKLRPTFDWELLIPQSMPVTDRIRMHRLLQVMAGTTQLGEARNAFAFVQHILEDHNCSWEKLAA